MRWRISNSVSVWIEIREGLAEPRVMKNCGHAASTGFAVSVGICRLRHLVIVGLIGEEQ